MRPRVLPEAEAEAVQAALWYEDRQKGLGEKFYDQVAATVLAIGRSPARFPVYEAVQLNPPVRRARVGRFPYYVIYAFNDGDDEPCVIAVIHSSRRPGFWADRS